MGQAAIDWREQVEVLRVVALGEEDCWEDVSWVRLGGKIVLTANANVTAIRATPTESLGVKYIA